MELVRQVQARMIYHHATNYCDRELLANKSLHLSLGNGTFTFHYAVRTTSLTGQLVLYLVATVSANSVGKQTIMGSVCVSFAYPTQYQYLFSPLYPITEYNVNY